MSALHHALSLLQYDAGNLHVTVGRLVEGRGDDLSVDGTCHVCYLLRTLVNQQHHDICLGVVGGDSIGYILHEDGLTRLWLSDNQCALSFTDW